MTGHQRRSRVNPHDRPGFAMGSGARSAVPGGPRSRRRDPDAAAATEVFDAHVDTEMFEVQVDDRRTGGPDVIAVHVSREFQELRHRKLRFAFSMTGVFLAWYLLFVLLSAFAPELMRTPALGSVNIGMLLGLSQFVSTLAIVIAYQRFARDRIDPGVDALQRAYDPQNSRPVR